MSGLAALALGTAPLLGGMLVGAAAGNLKGPDLHAAIQADLDLLDRIPADQTERRAGLQRSIDAHIDDLIAAADQRRAWRAALLSYHGNWRDIVLFVCTILFAFIWWHVEHGRANWLPLFITLIVLAMISGVYAVRGALRATTTLLRHRSAG